MNSNSEYEATLENIRLVGMPFTYRFHLPQGWEAEVYSWLAKASPRSIEGGHPGEGDVEMAIMGIGYTENDQ